MSGVEAAEFARRGAADVTADYMSACVQRRKAAGQDPRSCQQSSEVKEAVAATLGKNVSIIPQEEIDLVIKRC